MKSKITLLVLWCAAFSASAQIGNILNDFKKAADATTQLQQNQSTQSELIVRIGNVAPISAKNTNIRNIAVDAQNGALLAIDDANQLGIMLNGKKVKFELVALDDLNDTNAANEAAKKIISSNVVAVVGHYLGNISIATSKLYFERGIPQLSPTVANPTFTRQGYSTAFRIIADSDQQGSLLGTYAVKNLKAKSIAIVKTETPYGSYLSSGFQRAVERNGGAINSIQSVSDSEAIIRQVVNVLKEKNPDIIFFAGTERPGGLLLKSMIENGLMVRLLGGDGICTEDFVVNVNKAIPDNQVICVDDLSGVGDENSTSYEIFKKKYSSKYQEKIVFSPYSYDSIMLIANAIKLANSIERDKILSFLSKSNNYRGVTGSISFDQFGNNKNAALTMKTFRSNKMIDIAVFHE